jgi:peroxiredoxin
MNTHPYVRTLPMALAVALLTTAVLQAQAPAPPPPPSVKVGQEAPDFSANYLAPADANGRRQRKEVKLSDFKGQKNVVLAFFPAAFSSGCTNEMTKYQETAGQFNANNTVILGISVDSPWANAAFAEKLGAQFTMRVEPTASSTNRTWLPAAQRLSSIAPGSCSRCSWPKKPLTRLTHSRPALCSRRSSNSRSPPARAPRQRRFGCMRTSAPSVSRMPGFGRLHISFPPGKFARQCAASFAKNCCSLEGR